MRCKNCGLPFSPMRTITHCPRCGTPLHMPQGDQPQAMQGSSTVGGFQQNPWGQMAAPAQNPFAGQNPPEQSQVRSDLRDGFNQPWQARPLPTSTGTSKGLPQTGMPPREPQRPRQSPRRRRTPRLGFLVAGLCLVLAALLLILVTVLAFSAKGNVAQNTSSSSTSTTINSTPLPSPTSPSVIDALTPTAGSSISPTPTGTTYPGQQYIDHAQMAMGVDPKTLVPQQPTTTFKSGTNMYVAFDIHPPAQGGAVCSIWYLETNEVTVYNFSVSGNGGSSYTYATYSSGSAGSAYVELYWASDKSCLDKVLAQRVTFTVTA